VLTSTWVYLLFFVNQKEFTYLPDIDVNGKFRGTSIWKHLCESLSNNK